MEVRPPPPTSLKPSSEVKQISSFVSATSAEKPRLSANPDLRQRIMRKAVSPEAAPGLTGNTTSFVEGFQTRRITKAGKPVFSTRLNSEGKLFAASSFKDAKEEGYDPQALLTNALEDRGIEAGIIKSSKEAIRVQAKQDYAIIKQSTHKDERKSLPLYRDVVAKIIADDRVIQEAKARQKILNSIAMHARRDIKKDLTTQIKTQLILPRADGILQLTPEGEKLLADFKLELQAKGKILPPNLALNALIQKLAARKVKGEEIEGLNFETIEVKQVQPAVLLTQASTAEQTMQAPPAEKTPAQLAEEKEKEVQAHISEVRNAEIEGAKVLGVNASRIDEERKAREAHIAEVRRQQNERAARLSLAAKQREGEKGNKIAQRLGSLLAKTTGDLSNEVKAILSQMKQKSLQTALAAVVIASVGTAALGFLKEGGGTAFAEGISNTVAAIVTPTRTPAVSRLISAEKIAPSPLQTEAIRADITSVQEAPKPQVKKVYDFQSQYFGIRNDEAADMNEVGEIGAKFVRINGSSAELIQKGSDNTGNPLYKLKDSKLEDALTAAKEHDLKTLFILDSGTKAIPKEEVQKRVEYIMQNYQNVIIEVGNEMDDPSIPRWGSGKWTKEDRQSYADFLRTVAETSWKINPDQKIVVGALVNEANISGLVDAFKNAGIKDVNKLIFGIHVYDLPAEVQKRAELVKKATDGAEVYFTEVGSGKNDTAVTLSLIEEARKYSKLVVVHQLDEYPEERVENGNRVVYHFGYYNREEQKRTDRFYQLLNGLKQIEQKAVNLKN